MTRPWLAEYKHRRFMTMIEVHFWDRDAPPIEMPAKLDTGSPYTFIPGIVTRPSGFSVGDKCGVEVFVGSASRQMQLDCVHLTVPIRAEGGEVSEREMFRAEVAIPGFEIDDTVLVSVMRELAPPFGTAEYAIIGNDILIEHGSPFNVAGVIPLKDGACFSTRGYNVPVCPGFCP